LLNPDVLLSTFGLIGLVAVVFIETCSDSADRRVSSERNP
jgi:hypothetical protein